MAQKSYANQCFFPLDACRPRLNLKLSQNCRLFVYIVKPCCRALIFCTNSFKNGVKKHLKVKPESIITGLQYGFSSQWPCDFEYSYGVTWYPVLSTFSAKKYPNVAQDLLIGSRRSLFSTDSCSSDCWPVKRKLHRYAGYFLSPWTGTHSVKKAGRVIVLMSDKPWHCALDILDLV